MTRLVGVGLRVVPTLGAELRASDRSNPPPITIATAAAIAGLLVGFIGIFGRSQRGARTCSVLSTISRAPNTTRSAIRVGPSANHRSRIGLMERISVMTVVLRWRRDARRPRGPRASLGVRNA